jgi:replication factor A1
MFNNISRGRPKGRSNLYEDPLKSIVPIAVKHDLDPKLLVNAFVEAWRNNDSKYGSLKINCRMVNEESAIFLVTKGSEVISQFPINLEALKSPEFFKNLIQHIQIPKPKKSKENKQMKISELRVGMKRVNVKAKIIEIPPRRLVQTMWGGRSYVSNTKISDETGSITLSLWNNQIGRFNIGDKIEIMNGVVTNFAGKLQLRLRKNSHLSKIDEE